VKVLGTIASIIALEGSSEMEIEKSGVTDRYFGFIFASFATYVGKDTAISRSESRRDELSLIGGKFR
jgi:hypothetical protein